MSGLTIFIALRFRRSLILLYLLLAIVSAYYAATHFVINSDTDTLLSASLPWRQRSLALETAFRRVQTIDVVLNAPTPELTLAASSALATALREDKAHVLSVRDVSQSDFFATHSLLFDSPEAFTAHLHALREGQGFIIALAQDPSLRGISAILEGALRLDGIAPFLSEGATQIRNGLAHRPASFSWLALLDKRRPQGFLEIQPRLDFNAIEPGEEATNALRQIADKILPAYQAQMRLTGPVIMADEEFATIKENAVRNGVITSAIVLLILALALRSAKLMLAVLANLIIGLPITTAIGLYLVGQFNLISVYFAVLFVGIGIDFSIQFAVRYRADRYETHALEPALRATALYMARPLTLAGLATALGFFCFMPTEYKGVSELGIIAGCGMLIAYVSSLTFLPALIFVLNPKGEPEPLSYEALGALDDFFARHRKGILVGTIALILGLVPALHRLQFDFNPLNLRNPNTEGMQTYLALKQDPAANLDTIEVLAPNLTQANAIAAKVRPLAEVEQATILADFIPEDQDERLQRIGQELPNLRAALQTQPTQVPPNDEESLRLLERLAADFRRSPSGDNKALADVFDKLREAKDRQALIQSLFITPLQQDLALLKAQLSLGKITLNALPQDLRSAWLTEQGQARVAITPRNARDNTALQAFAEAVQAVVPEATEGPIPILEARRTVLRAFFEAGGLAILSIALLLWMMLGRFSYMLLTLIPLVSAGLVTLEICALVGIKLNFANIIAFPLLLGVGVAFKIYYIIAWMGGEARLLKTSLTRAVLFSALTTATAFGGLMLSSHPGTASMGLMLALSLASTFCAAVFFQPLLMGKLY